MRQAKLTFCVIGLLIFSKVMAIEEAQYKVLLKEDNVEVRQYKPYIVAETLVNETFEEAGSKAFNLLFDYISGKNQSQQEIAMTAPVSQTGQKIDMTAPVSQQKTDNGWWVSFMMPASFTLDSLPKPNNPNVSLKKYPAQLMASIEYSGFWSESNYLDNKSKLENWITQQGYKPMGSATWARYNAPFTPWFLRRNEVLIPVAELDKKE